MKKDTVSKAKKAAWTAFSRFIRMRDCLYSTGSLEYGYCCTCGKAYDIKALQAGHFIPGRNNSILFDPRCVHIQCRGCNLYGGGQQPAYYRFMIERYGHQTVDELFRQASMSLKLTAPDLRDLATRFTEWAKYIERNEIVPSGEVGEYVDELRAKLGLDAAGGIV